MRISDDSARLNVSAAATPPAIPLKSSSSVICDVSRYSDAWLHSSSLFLCRIVRIDASPLRGNNNQRLFPHRGASVRRKESPKTSSIVTAAMVLNCPTGRENTLDAYVYTFRVDLSIINRRPRFFVSVDVPACGCFPLIARATRRE